MRCAIIRGACRDDPAHPPGYPSRCRAERRLLVLHLMVNRALDGIFAVVFYATLAALVVLGIAAAIAQLAITPLVAGAAFILTTKDKR
jgi:hypothetical protein